MNNHATSAASSASSSGEDEKEDNIPLSCASALFARSLKTYYYHDYLFNEELKEKVVSDFNTKLLLQKCDKNYSNDDNNSNDSNADNDEDTKPKPAYYDPTINLSIVLHELFQPNEKWIHRPLLLQAMTAYAQCHGFQVKCSQESIQCKLLGKENSNCAFKVRIKACHRLRYKLDEEEKLQYKKTHRYKNEWDKAIEIVGVNFEHGEYCLFQEVMVEGGSKRMELKKKRKVDSNENQDDDDADADADAPLESLNSTEKRRKRDHDESDDEDEDDSGDEGESMPATLTNPKIRRYLIARHGETNYNKEHRVQGTLDTPVILSYDGIAQASKLGTFIAHRQKVPLSPSLTIYKTTQSGAIIMNDPPITKTWCSPMQRCRQTYAAIDGCCSAFDEGNSNNQNQNNGQQQHPCPTLSDHHHPLPKPTIHWNLQEIHLCEWQGRLRKNVALEEKHNWSVFKTNPKQLTLKDGFRPVLDCWERGMNNWKVIRGDAYATSSNAVEDDEATITSINATNSASAVLAATLKASASTRAKLANPANSSNTNNGNANGAIFIMCHGAIGQAMLLQALGLDIDLYGKSKKYAFDNCDCIEIEWMDGEETSRRWRRVHPVKTLWLSTRSSQALAGELACGR